MQKIRKNDLMFANLINKKRYSKKAFSMLLKRYLAFLPHSGKLREKSRILH